MIVLKMLNILSFLSFNLFYIILEVTRWLLLIWLRKVFTFIV